MFLNFLRLFGGKKCKNLHDILCKINRRIFLAYWKSSPESGIAWSCWNLNMKQHFFCRKMTCHICFLYIMNMINSNLASKFQFRFQAIRNCLNCWNLNLFFVVKWRVICVLYTYRTWETQIWHQNFNLSFWDCWNCWNSGLELLEFEPKTTFLSQNKVSYMFSIHIEHEKLKSGIKISIWISGNPEFWNLDAKLTSVTAKEIF